MKNRIASGTNQKITISGLALCLLILMPSEAWQQSRKPMTFAELVTYDVKYREQVLYAGAKGVCKITWFTSLAGASYIDMVREFES
jgi:hypothetical protein